MEDWEDEKAPTLLSKDQPVHKWDDEDVDENDITESWEDLDEPAPLEPATRPVSEKAPKKPAIKPAEKATEKKGKTVQIEREEPLDPVAEKLRQQSFHYIGLLKAVMRLSMTSLKGADAKEVASSITAIANEKIKAEKEANAGKKKTGAKKKQLLVDKPNDDIAVDDYDPLDDYDFM